MQNKGITLISIHFRPEFEIVSYPPCSLGGGGVLRLMFAGYVRFMFAGYATLAARDPIPL